VSNTTTKIVPLAPSELDCLREVDESLPPIGEGDWRDAWADLFRAAEQGMCWALREREQHDPGEGERDPVWHTLAYVIVMPHFFGRWLIRRLHVIDSRRREGLASTLVRFVERRCPGDDIVASVRDADANVAHLLEGLGYEPIGELRRLLRNGDDLQIFLRPLPPPDERGRRAQSGEAESQPASDSGDAEDGAAETPEPAGDREPV
jgi:GNAT superfamily N-acetyltransferase